MTTHFIEAEIDLTADPADLPQAIERELRQRGEPLRWAVTEADADRRTARVEAIVTDAAPESADRPAHRPANAPAQ